MSYIHSKLKRNSRRRNSDDTTQKVCHFSDMKKMYVHQNLHTVLYTRDTASNNISLNSIFFLLYFFSFSSYRFSEHQCFFVFVVALAVFGFHLAVSFALDSIRNVLHMKIPHQIEFGGIRNTHSARMCVRRWKIWRSIVATGYNTIVETHQKARIRLCCAIAESLLACARVRLRAFCFVSYGSRLWDRVCVCAIQQRQRDLLRRLFACLLVWHHMKNSCKKRRTHCRMAANVRSVSETIATRRCYFRMLMRHPVVLAGETKYKKMLNMIFVFSLFTEDRRFDSHNLKMVMTFNFHHYYRIDRKDCRFFVCLLCSIETLVWCNVIHCSHFRMGDKSINAIR